MKRVSSIVAVSLALTLVHATHSSASDVEEGKELFALQCEICHGAMYAGQTGNREPSSSPRRIQLAMLDSLNSDVTHSLSGLIPGVSAEETRLQSMPTGDHLAVAMPNGPPLGGIVGRPAATFEGYAYSKAFMKTLKGVVWSEEKLDRWITSSQAVVPGSFMYYKQEDLDARRKIILYLKANP